MAISPMRAIGKRSGSSRSRGVTGRVGGTDVSKRNCANSTPTASTALPKKAARQPNRSPINAPAGTPQTAPTEIPLRINAVARPWLASGTRWRP
ncbi:hypothetical protein D3C79_1020800 [compost metagenome]